jgi:hypothetical protein
MNAARRRRASSASIAAICSSYSRVSRSMSRAGAPRSRPDDDTHPGERLLLTSASCVATDAYRLCRHPMHLGFALILLRLALLMGTVTAFVVVPAFVMETEAARLVRGMDRRAPWKHVHRGREHVRQVDRVSLIAPVQQHLEPSLRQKPLRPSRGRPSAQRGRRVPDWPDGCGSWRRTQRLMGTRRHTSARQTPRSYTSGRCSPSSRP